MSLRVLSNLNSESRSTLYTKRDKIKLVFLIIIIEKRDFLQTSNINILYTLESIFLRDYEFEIITSK